MDQPQNLTLDQAHAHFARTINGEVWELLGKEARTPEDNERMIHAAHTSLYHWLHCGTPVHHQRGEWMCAHVYTVLGHAEPALRHAARCMELTEAHRGEMKDFDVAYAYEGIARAQALAGRTAEASAHHQQAKVLGDTIADSEDKSIFVGDFEGGEWYGVVGKG